MGQGLNKEPLIRTSLSPKARAETDNHRFTWPVSELLDNLLRFKWLSENLPLATFGNWNHYIYATPRGTWQVKCLFWAHGLHVAS